MDQRHRARLRSLSATLDRYDVEVDGFGRTWREYRKIFDGTWAQRITAYNGMGRTTTVSEWQAVSPPPTLRYTEYLNFDPFGRPGIIRPPDGSTHDTTFTYTGIRLTSRAVKVATAVGSETTATTTEEYDRQGRLWKVTEPSGASGRQRHHDLHLRRRRPPEAGLDPLRRHPEPDLHLRQPRLPHLGAAPRGRHLRATGPSPTRSTTPGVTRDASRTASTTSPSPTTAPSG